MPAKGVLEERKKKKQKERKEEGLRSESFASPWSLGFRLPHITQLCAACRASFDRGKSLRWGRWESSTRRWNWRGSRNAENPFGRVARPRIACAPAVPAKERWEPTATYSRSNNRSNRICYFLWPDSAQMMGHGMMMMMMIMMMMAWT